MAAFQKGVPRPPNAGRKKGSKNIRKVAKVADILCEKGIDPTLEILKILETLNDEGESVLKPRERIEVWMDLQSYCQAKPKAVDEDPNDEVDEEEFQDLTSADLLKLVKPNEAK